MKSRTLSGLALMTAAFAFIGAGTYVLFSAMDMQQINTRRNAETSRQCTEKLAEIAKAANGTVSQKGLDTVMILKDFGDPRMALSAADTAIMMCPNKDVTEQCIGDKCEDANNKVVLRMTFKEKTR
jgi:hypothetical protein